MNPDSGEFILEQLRGFGSDTNRKHEVSFWMYFPNQDSADHAASDISKTGLRTEVTKSVIDTKWLCMAYCWHIPDEKILDGIAELLSEVTKRHGGIFDGWEASLEGENINIPTTASRPPRVSDRL
jgi:hypothetical protein